MTNTDIEKFITEAIKNRKVLKMEYISNRSGYTVRYLNPFLLFRHQNKNDGNIYTYITGGCELREEALTFRVDRIKRISITNKEFHSDIEWQMPNWALENNGMKIVSI